MKYDYVNKENIFEYIKDNISDFKIKYEKVTNAKYHHNTDYLSAPSIIKYGLLPVNALNKMGIKEYSSDLLKIFKDENSHINGIFGISLSIPYLTDLYDDEFEYNPFDKNKVDFLVSSNIKTIRNTTHYGNEFISYNEINQDMLSSVDVRIIEYLGYLMSKNDVTKENYLSLVRKYNSLIMMAQNMCNDKLDIPFREKSFNEKYSLDKEKISSAKVLVLKK